MKKDDIREIINGLSDTDIHKALSAIHERSAKYHMINKPRVEDVLSAIKEFEDTLKLSSALDYEYDADVFKNARDALKAAAFMIRKKFNETNRRIG